MIGASALRDRLLIAAHELGVATGGNPATLEATLGVLATGLGEATHRSSYLLLAVTTGTIPTAEQVVAFEREWRLSGTAKALERLIATARAANRWTTGAAPLIHVERGLIVDVHDTANTRFTTGIQRVVRSTLPIWMSGHELLLVAWTAGFTAPRTMSSAENTLARGAAVAPQIATGRDTRARIVVPFEATWILPEIAVDERRAARTRSIALYSGSRAVAIGYDCIPITSAETAGGGMPGGFARYLSALAEFDLVAPISGASATEFEGWRGMLGGAGLIGPGIRAVPLSTSLAAEEPTDDSESLAEAGIPEDAVVVLAVGSHEPRKNHLALLQAAELAWRDGVDFTLVLVGGNSWDTAGFDAAVAAARARGRSLITLSAAPDSTVWALYRRARFSVFPSLNEGFGLPVVESISRGTPVITSDFGSMREAAEGFGGVLVDPRDDEALAAAIRLLLADDSLIATLTKQTASAPQRDWAEYARELWTTLIAETT
jgi:glycosyltransferase involved in cell wall biosynthesis